MSERIRVELAERAYDVVVGDGILGDLDGLLPPFPGAERSFVVCDRRLADELLPVIGPALERSGLPPVHLGVPEGEEAKTLEVAETLYRLLATQGAHRGDPIVALGGGAVGDVAGFVAATYMRGLPVVQVSTTLTGQVDAAIGGKTAVDLPEGKNMVGAFHQPAVVICDVATLTTLEDRDYRSGLGEVAKYAVSLDTGLLELLRSQTHGVLAREAGTMLPVVARCARIKARVVAADEREGGERMFLNYGHTLGHAIERAEDYRGRTHGEAIVVGMLFAARLAEDLGMAPEGMTAEHRSLFDSLGLDGGGMLPAAADLVEAMRLDKKYRQGVRFVLLRGTGAPEVVEDVPEDAIRRILIEMGASA